MQNEHFTFISNCCEQAILDLKHTTSNRRWLTLYQGLYNTLSSSKDELLETNSSSIGFKELEKIKLFSNVYFAISEALERKNKNKIHDGTFIYLIDSLALFEDRRYTNASQDTFLFIKRDFLNLSREVKNYIPTIQPISDSITSKLDYIYALDAKLLIPISEYNNILLTILELSTQYEQVNILFPYFMINKDFDEKNIEKLIEYSLNSNLVRRSFEAQNLMLDFVVKNKRKIESKLLNTVLLEFPHAHGLFRNTNPIKFR